MIHLGDITEIDGAAIPPVDVITGGSPCQDLSVAGKREGLDGERSGLFMEMIRVVKEMREHDRSNGRTGEFIRPRYMVWENVPGAFSSNKGKDFQAVLTEIVKIVNKETPDVPMPEKGGGGLMQDASTMNWGNGALLGEFTMRSFGESPKEENESHLSQILEEEAHPKYFLSAKACQGILRRAKEKNKPLPEELEKALIDQVALTDGTSNQSTSNQEKELQKPCTQESADMVGENHTSTIAIEGNAGRQSHHGQGVSKDTMYSLNTVETHAVFNDRTSSE